GTAVGYAPKSGLLFVDRTNAGESAFNYNFAQVHTAPFVPDGGRLKLHIFVDRASVEVLANDGLVSFSEQIFPSEGSVGLELFAEGTAVTLHSLTIYALGTARHLPHIAPSSQRSVKLPAG
ncbi:MAG: GH32 C-terminal domain-containing protein, partial [Chloroflexota bacterium]